MLKRLDKNDVVRLNLAIGVANEIHESHLGGGVHPAKRSTSARGEFWILVYDNGETRHYPPAKGLRFRSKRDAELWLTVSRAIDLWKEIL